MKKKSLIPNLKKKKVPSELQDRATCKKNTKKKNPNSHQMTKWTINPAVPDP